MTNKRILYEALKGGKAPRVLVVEDDPVSAKLIMRNLDKEGVAYEHVKDAKEALEKVRKGSFRLIVSDWMMPGMSGVELCQQVRETSTSYVYFILCTARGEREDRRTAFEAGVDDFLNKPLDADEFRARLTVANRVLSVEENLIVQSWEVQKAHEALQEINGNLVVASRRFAELFNGLPVACFTFDETGTIHEWNRAAEAQFGIPSFKSFLQPIWEVLGGTGNEFWTPDRVQAIVSNFGCSEVEWTFISSFGTQRHFVTTCFALRNDAGEFIGAIAANQDITERILSQRRIEEQIEQINDMMRVLEVQKMALEDANSQLSHRADTDGLTGLFNHRRFQGDLADAFEQSVKNSKPLSVILLDVDYFKKFNDTFGHQHGDEVLMKFAEILRSTSRKNEVVARYGGEEFAIILEGCPTDAAIRAAERFREAVEKTTWEHRPITASFGVATLTPEVSNHKELLVQADTALYLSKERGRNRVTHFDRQDDSGNGIAAA